MANERTCSETTSEKPRSAFSLLSARAMSLMIDGWMYWTVLLELHFAAHGLLRSPALPQKKARGPR
jgi:hypothetical protein